MKDDQLDRLKNMLITAHRILKKNKESNSLLKYFVKYDIIPIVDKSHGDVDKFVSEVFKVNRGESSLSILLKESDKSIEERNNHSLLVVNKLIKTIAENNPEHLTKVIEDL